MSVQAGRGFNYEEMLAREGRLIPFRKLLTATASELTHLSNRVGELEQQIGRVLFSGGLLFLVAIAAYFIIGVEVAAMAGVVALYAIKDLPVAFYAKQQNVSGIGRFEERLCAYGFGVRWGPKSSSGEMRVDIFWLDTSGSRE